MISISEINAIAKEFNKKFFDDSIPLEFVTFKIVDRKDRFLGETLGKFIGENRINEVIVSIQKVVQDKETLEKVIAHELIHCWEYFNLSRKELQMAKHGSSFRSFAKKINSMMGKDYVTEKSDSSYKLQSRNKPFYILIQPADYVGKGLYGATISHFLSSKQKEEIKNRQEKDNAKLFKISDDRFLSCAPIKRFGGFSYFSTNKELNTELERIYKSDKEVVAKMRGNIEKLVQAGIRVTADNKIQKKDLEKAIGVLADKPFKMPRSP